METILEEALRITNGQRRQDYGTMESSFQAMATLWSAYLGDLLKRPLKAEETAFMMILMKIAREQNAHKRDNLVDIAGYARCVSVMAGDEIGLKNAI